MTNFIDHDDAQKNQGKNLSLALSSSDSEMMGLRVTRADFARLMGCSKQAVTDWVKSGRIVVGADARFDPRQAVASLLRTGDPARIRAKVLEPLVRDIGLKDRRIRELEKQLAEKIEDAEFHEASNHEFIAIEDALIQRLQHEWLFLAGLPHELGLATVMDWICQAQKRGGDAGTFRDIAELAAMESQVAAFGALGDEEGGDGVIFENEAIDGAEKMEKGAEARNIAGNVSLADLENQEAGVEQDESTNGCTEEEEENRG